MASSSMRSERDWCCANIQIPHLINVYITVANVIHAHPCSEGVKELGEAHLSWQLPVWELLAQSSELDTSGGIERRQKNTLITKHSFQTVVTQWFNNQIESFLENLCNIWVVTSEHLLFVHIWPNSKSNKHLCIEITMLNTEYFNTKAK